MLVQHLHPAWSVAGNAQGFVVDAPVLVVGSGCQHGVDRALHLVGERDDGLLVALANGQRLELGLERAACPGSGLGELAQQPAYPGVATPDAAAPSRISCMGLPSMRALTMARALWPWMSATSTLSRIPASTSTLCSRFFSALHMPTSFCRWRATRRSWRICTGGMNEARSSPARASVASHCASATSVLRPGTALTCRALTTHAMMPTASSAAYGLQHHLGLERRRAVAVCHARWDDESPWRQQRCLTYDLPLHNSCGLFNRRGLVRW